MVRYNAIRALTRKGPEVLILKKFKSKQYFYLSKC